MDDDNDGVVKVSSDDDEDAGQAGLTRIPLFCIECDMHHIVVTFQRWHLPAYLLSLDLILHFDRLWCKSSMI